MTADAHYYDAMKPGSLAERLGVRARKAMFEELMRRCRPSPEFKVVDIGVSAVETDAANLFERLYPWPGAVTCCGLDSAALPAELAARIKFVRIESGKPFPFEDGAFDLLVSNAVLEHTGDAEKQAAFLRESKRIAKTLFITVPHRFFPVEHHTGLPLLHYSPALFRAVTRRLPDKQIWADPDQLWFHSAGSLRALARGAFGGGVEITVGGAGIGPWPVCSNLFLHVTGR